MSEVPPAAPADTPPRRWPVVTSSVAVLLLGAATVAIAPWDPDRMAVVRDRLAVWAEPSSPQIVAIAESTGMSEAGTLIYLASTPEIETTSAFNDDCDVEGDIVLGCYVDREIFVYAVTDDRLAGTTEVTAAHEMLHAAYERLDLAEREAVDALVDEYVATIPLDARLFEDLEGYPGWQLPDELHSRLGTEFADLPPALEAHYAVYFDDRTKVVALHERSIAVILELEAQIDALVAEIDVLGADLDARSAAYDAALAQLDADIAAFNARAERPGGFATQAAFDQARAALLARSAALDADAAAYNADIDRYNALVADLTALDADYAGLYETLDSANAPDDVE